jgi:ATP-dependent exoDNAse (exonuclease V) alpha subunit
MGDQNDIETQLHAKRGKADGVRSPSASPSSSAERSGGGSGRPTAGAIYHLSVKTISRSAGRSATAAAAYRAGEEITDERTGEVHDYTRKDGVLSSDLVLPDGAPEWARDREALWNAAEQAEKRKNSTVAREFEVALPSVLSDEQRRALALDLARQIADRHGCAVDVCIHAPSREGDQRNHHAHLLMTTRRLTPEGFSEKTRELDEKIKTEARPVLEVERWRAQWAAIQNEHLKAAGFELRVDHRSLAKQGVERAPTHHLGPAATGYERRTKQASRRRADQSVDKAKAQKEAAAAALDAGIIDAGIEEATGELSAAKSEKALELARSWRHEYLAKEAAAQAQPERKSALQILEERRAAEKAGEKVAPQGKTATQVLQERRAKDKGKDFER